MIAGEQKSVGYSILPIGNNDSSCSWSSDNEIVASVDERTGLITARSMGTANISITSRLSGAKATVKVYVVGLSKTSLTLPQYSATIIDLQVYGASKSDLVVKWLSDNEQIAEVGERTGKVTARKVGTTTIYAIVNGRRLPCKVKVTGS